jgi:hypothetical protein
VHRRGSIKVHDKQPHQECNVSVCQLALNEIEPGEMLKTQQRFRVPDSLIPTSAAGGSSILSLVGSLLCHISAKSERWLFLEG